MANLDLKNPAIQKIVLSSLLTVGVLGVFFFTHLLPFTFPNQREHINVLKDDYERKNTDLARARATVADLPRFEAEYEQLHQRWSLAAELLPADRQLAVLLRKITLAAEQTGVQFMVFKPAGAKSEQYYTELPLQVQVNGGYHQVGSFLAELANMQRIITVSNVKLKTNANTTNGLMTTSADFTASAFSLNTTPAAPQDANPKPKKEGAAHASKS
jgi:type IV pilus assembly protein PilO